METNKTYKMLKTVQGSLDGFTLTNFAKDDIRKDITPELAEQFYHQGAIEEISGNPADAREKKVTGPTETKEGEAGVPLDTQNIEELVALARDHYGLDVDSTMDEATLRDMIEQARGEQAEDIDLSKMTKKELLAHAETLGLELDESGKKDDLIAAIEAHNA